MFDQLGLYLRAVRNHRGWSMAEVVSATRIRKDYLAAIENGDMSALPSRPFALGYVRAYAKALGLDGELALARFKQEHPQLYEPLRAPIGVKHQEAPSRPVATLAVGGLIAAVVVWNVVQRVLSLTDPPPPAAAADPLLDTPPPPPPKTNGAFILGAPTAPPPEATTPAPYVTPGLEAVIGPMTEAARVEAGGLDELTPGAPFETRGAIYGAPPSSPSVLIQARKSALLVVRRPDHQVYFAHQLKAGEALRAPTGKGLILDVTEPLAFYAFGPSGLIGALSTPQTAVEKLAADGAALDAARASANQPAPQGRPAGAGPAGL
jgi:cytoskeleton protein RodZ